MEMTVEKFESHAVSDGKGGLTITSEQRVGPIQRFEFGGPDDDISAAVGGSYISQWSPDFIQKAIGRGHNFARFYFDRKVAVDVADPEDSASKRKRKLLHENGFAYLCIPPEFPQEVEKVKNLYTRAINEYYAYEALHPRPVVYQEVEIPGEGNQPPRKLKIRAIDVKVGGGLTISPAEAQEEAERNAKELTKVEQEVLHERARIMKAIRKCAERGQPFRNPFIKKGGIRLYNVDYGTTRS